MLGEEQGYNQRLEEEPGDARCGEACEVAAHAGADHHAREVALPLRGMDRGVLSTAHQIFL